MVAEPFNLDRFYEGDLTAFDQLYTTHAQTLYRLGWSMLGQEQAAEDVVQETFLRAYKARKRFTPAKASMGTWLYQIALNYCRSQLRRKQIRPFSWLDMEPESIPDLGRDTNPERSLVYDDNQQLLWKAINKLKPRLHEVIVLHYYLDIPAVEIAKMLDCPEGTIYSRLHNARKQLAKSLSQQGVIQVEILEF